MRDFKALKISIFILCFVMLMIGCTSPSKSVQPSPTSEAAGDPQASSPSSPPPSPVITPTPTPTPDPIQEQINHMSLDEKIGQLVIVGLDGTEMDEQAQKLIETYKVGGFILFKRNIETAEQTVALLNGLKQTNAKSNTAPLFLSVDEEGGRVSRMPDQFVKIPTNQTIGKTGDPELARQIGEVIAKEIGALGFNMDFAPVLDIFSNPKNTVIGDRSFGNNPQQVSRFGTKMMQGLSSEQMIPVIKHFPGHGDTLIDSHEGLPIVHKTKDQLKEFELIPFVQAIKQGAEVVMVAHIQLPKLDASHPASLSEPVITGLLREELQFEGLIITDDLTMGAITEHYDTGQAAVQAFLAGSDLLLVCHDYDSEFAAIQALKQAAVDGTLSQGRIDESVYRILKIKQKYQMSDNETPAIKINPINQEINRVLKALL